MKGKLETNKKEKKALDADENGREIGKYLESHGEIRTGREFQSEIPSLMGRIESKSGKNEFNVDFRIWLEEKRKKVLSREICLPSF